MSDRRSISVDLDHPMMGGPQALVFIAIFDALTFWPT
jgi:hypothetical protein